ncbi:uncharacterized protein M6B38_252650 [Iris pallida]|uniref:Uncharacterized protein n=1 Tax=Iris pallida TaxID=29817 RepID=A0AAX6IHY4_IRIPA|nr:uncharacterized protein M6B38_252650 [Iris pallida]
MFANGSSVLLFFFLLLASRSNSLQLTQLKTLVSLSRSLLTRVSAARSARGDAAGASRAAALAEGLRLSPSFGVGGGGLWSVGWDFARSYAWRLGARQTAEITLAAAELAGLLSEAARSGPDRDWVVRNYARVIALSDKLLRSLLRAFWKAGPLREMVLLLQEEVVEGELLKDCLEVGAHDLEGLFQIARDLLLSMNSSNGEL